VVQHLCLAAHNNYNPSTAWIMDNDNKGTSNETK